MIFRRTWAMPDRNTFSIKPIRALIDRHFPDGETADPFANRCRIAKYCNDLDPDMQCESNMDALEFLKGFGDNTLDGILFDPPYSPRQVSESYRKFGMSVNMETTQASYWSNLKTEISRIVRTGGCVISASWNSGGIGKRYGFEIVEVLLVPHGGWHNDTIVVCEHKVSLF